MMSVKGYVMIIIGIFGVLAMALAMQGLMAGEWTVVAQDIAPAIIFIAVFIILIAAIIRR